MSLTITSVTNGQTISGSSVAITYTCDFLINVAPIYINGAQKTVQGGQNLYSTLTYNLDTTKYPNGNILIDILANDASGTHSGSAEITLNIQNGTIPIGIDAGFSALLTPGGTQQIAAKYEMSDGTRGTISNSLTYSSSNIAVATVSGGGLISYVGYGSCFITVTDSAGYTGSVRVVCRSSQYGPHLHTDGTISRTYNAATSIFYKALFGYMPSNAVSALKSMGATICEQGSISNPNDGSGWQSTTQSVTQSYINSHIASDAAAAIAGGLYPVETLDNVFRTANEYNWICECSWAVTVLANAVVYAQSQGAIAILGVDENYIGGQQTTPTTAAPQNYSSPFAVNGATYTATATQMTDAYTAMKNAASIPVTSLPPGKGNSSGIYAYRQAWTAVERGLHCLYWETLDQFSSGPGGTAGIGTASNLVWAIQTADYYANLYPDGDLVLIEGNYADGANNLHLFEACLLALYGWQGRNYIPGQHPSGGDPNSFSGDSSQPGFIAFKTWWALTEQFKADILSQPKISAKYASKDVLVGAWSGSTSTLVMFVNPVAQTRNVTFDPSAYPGTGTVTRYRTTPTGTASATVTGTDSITMQPFEIIPYRRVAGTAPATGVLIIKGSGGNLVLIGGM